MEFMNSTHQLFFNLIHKEPKWRKDDSPTVSTIEQKQKTLLRPEEPCKSMDLKAIQREVQKQDKTQNYSLHTDSGTMMLIFGDMPYLSSCFTISIGCKGTPKPWFVWGI